MRQGIALSALSRLRHFLVGLLQQSRNILLLFTQDLLPWLRRWGLMGCCMLWICEMAWICCAMRFSPILRGFI